LGARGSVSTSLALQRGHGVPAPAQVQPCSALERVSPDGSHGPAAILTNEEHFMV
jgi:hypothetical protein